MPPSILAECTATYRRELSSLWLGRCLATSCLGPSHCWLLWHAGLGRPRQPPAHRWRSRLPPAAANTGGRAAGVLPSSPLPIKSCYTAAVRFPCSCTASRFFIGGRKLRASAHACPGKAPPHLCVPFFTSEPSLCTTHKPAAASNKHVPEQPLLATSLVHAWQCKHPRLVLLPACGPLLRPKMSLWKGANRGSLRAPCILHVALARRQNKRT